MQRGPARGFLHGCAVGSGDQWSGPPDLRLSFGDASQHKRSFSLLVAEPSLQRDLAASPLGFERSGENPDTSLGVVNDRPSVDISAQRPLPDATSLRRAACSAQAPQGSGFRKTRQRPSARRCHPPNSFRPCRSSRLRRFAPLGAVQVCCTLQPTMGFATFRDLRSAPHGVIARIPPHARPASPPREGLAGRRWVSLSICTSEEALRDRVAQRTARTVPGSVPGGATPFEAFPSPAAVPRHRDPCPLAVGPSLRLTRSPHSQEDVAAE